MKKISSLTNISKNKLNLSTERRYTIDFDKFYSLIEKTQNLLNTMNKFEKIQHNQHYQILYKICNAN